MSLFEWNAVCNSKGKSKQLLIKPPTSYLGKLVYTDIFFYYLLLIKKNHGSCNKATLRWLILKQINQNDYETSKLLCNLWKLPLIAILLFYVKTLL